MNFEFVLAPSFFFMTWRQHKERELFLHSFGLYSLLFLLVTQGQSRYHLLPQPAWWGGILIYFPGQGLCLRWSWISGDMEADKQDRFSLLVSWRTIWLWILFCLTGYLNPHSLSQASFPSCGLHGSGWWWFEWVLNNVNQVVVALLAHICCHCPHISPSVCFAMVSIETAPLPRYCSGPP